MVTKRLTSSVLILLLAPALGSAQGVSNHGFAGSWETARKALLGTIKASPVGRERRFSFLVPNHAAGVFAHQAGQEAQAIYRRTAPSVFAP